MLGQKGLEPRQGKGLECDDKWIRIMSVQWRTRVMSG